MVLVSGDRKSLNLKKDHNKNTLFSFHLGPQEAVSNFGVINCFITKQKTQVNINVFYQKGYELGLGALCRRFLKKATYCN